LGGNPYEKMVINMIFLQQGKDCRVVTPPMLSSNVSDMKNQGNNGSHKCMSYLCQFQGIDPRGGTGFDKNGPNLTEDVSFAIGTTLVGIKGPEDV